MDLFRKSHQGDLPVIVYQVGYEEALLRKSVGCWHCCPGVGESPGGAEEPGGCGTEEWSVGTWGVLMAGCDDPCGLFQP